MFLFLRWDMLAPWRVRYFDKMQQTKITNSRFSHGYLPTEIPRIVDKIIYTHIDTCTVQVYNYH